MLPSLFFIVSRFLSFIIVFGTRFQTDNFAKMSNANIVEVEQKPTGDFVQNWFSKWKHSTLITIWSQGMYSYNCYTFCGTDQVDDPALMQYLQAELPHDGRFYVSRLHTKFIIERLLAIGFQIRGFSAPNDGSLWWTLQD